ncbi:MAG: ABC transporter permease [Trueperaceae bacterium]|nr:ABC transporter permease [Trueperaceae bacterium]
MTGPASVEQRVDARRLSASARPSGGGWGLWLAQTRAEFASSLRAPDFVIGVVAIPVMMFLMFGPPNARWTLPEGTRISTMMMPGFGAFGILSLVLFAFGVEIAQERGKGWLRLMRATPAPAWVYLGGKLAMSVLYAAVTLAALFAVAAAFAQVRLSPLQWLQVAGVLLAGGVALAPIGFALGFLARPRAASTIGNLVFLPLSFASGFFFPLSQLPAFLRELAPYLPTYHYGRLIWASFAPAADVTAYTGIEPAGAIASVAWLVGTFVAFSLLSLWAYRRDRRRDEG